MMGIDDRYRAAEGDTLKTEFIGGKPYQVDMSLAIYDEVEKNGQIQID